FFSSRRRHTRCYRDWSSDVCSSDLARNLAWNAESPRTLRKRRNCGLARPPRQPEAREKRPMGISFNAASLLNGNGIDVNSIVSQIEASQSGQLSAWQGDVTTLQTQAK